MPELKIPVSPTNYILKRGKGGEWTRKESPKDDSAFSSKDGLPDDDAPAMNSEDRKKYWSKYGGFYKGLIIKRDYDVTNMPPEKRKYIEKLVNDLDELSKNVFVEFVSKVEDILEEGGVRQKIVDHVLNTDFLQLRFQISEGVRAKNRLAEIKERKEGFLENARGGDQENQEKALEIDIHSYEKGIESLTEEDVVVSFVFPKIVNLDWQTEGEKFLKNQSIYWARLYFSKIEEVRKIIGRFEKKYGHIFERINAEFDHDKDYYYIYRVSPYDYKKD